MLARARLIILMWWIALAVPLAAAAQVSPGRIEGTLSRSTGAGIAGALVVIQQTGAAELTGVGGRYVFDKVAPGSYTIRFSLGENEATARVTVARDRTSTLAISVDWPLVFAEELTVVGASRHVERVVDAPASVTVITSGDIERRAADSQLPAHLASSPGVEAAQSSLYSYSLNLRGFNTLNGRRLPVFVDGRDPSTPVVLGNQEWGALPVPMDELAAIELIRGPVAALYGAGAFNGIVNITTKAPRDTLGGLLRVSFGELHTIGVSGRQGGKLGTGWFYRASGAYQRSRDFTASRVTGVEYDGLQREVVAVPDKPIALATGSIRFDRSAARVLSTFEAGTSSVESVTAVTPAGRSFATSVQRPWARVNVSWPGWNALGYYTGRMADDLKSLNAGSSVYLSESSVGMELQHHRLFARGRGQFIGGSAYRRQDVDSLDPNRRQTVFPEAESASQGSVFGQIDWNAAPRVKLVGSGRWESSTLHSARFSPRGAVVFTPAAGHNVRVNFSNAFQSPSLVEFFLRVPVGPPVDLSAVEAALAPLLGGTSLGWSNIPLLAVGNPHLRVERIGSIEAGYTGVAGKTLFFSFDYFHNELRDFTSNLLPQTGTSLGRLNANFQPYAPPASLPAPAASSIIGTLRSVLPANLFAAMSNDANGRPVFALLSFGNAGRARGDGIETLVTYWPRPSWRFDASYSWFTFDVGDGALEVPIQANTPKHQVHLSGTYAGPKTSGSLNLRWVNRFEWSSGVFSGPVPSYAVVDASVSQRISPNWRAELTVANLLNRRHYEAFGGAILRRRALGSVVYEW